MRIDRNTLLFFDASCLIAAAGSPSGGSGFLLSLCQKGLLKAGVSQPVLLEAERNILAKLDTKALVTYHRLLVSTPMIVAPVPSKTRRRTYQDIVGEKDEHVLAASIAIRTPFLLTLDKPLATRVNQANLSLRAFSPGDFMKTVLPNHIDYPKISD